MSLGMNTRTTSQSVTVAIVLSILSTLWLLPANRCCCFADSSAQMYPLKILAIPTYDPDLPPLMNLTVLPLTKKQVKLPRAKKASAYLLTTTEALSVVLPTTTSTGCYKSEYDFRPPDANPVNCAQRKFVRTTQQAAQNRCVFATNGGPFHQDGSSVGVVIANGRTVTAEYGGSGNVGFGVAHQQPNERRARATKQRWWVIGSINNAEQAATLGLQQFVTGFNWLVYDGKAVANQFNDTTGASEAPRTAIGVNRNGQLMLLVADGCELCLHHKGLTLGGVADLLVREGAQYAVNLDGGSSSVLVDQNEKIFSRPTCLDLPFVCERPVTTVMCIHYRKGR